MKFCGCSEEAANCFQGRTLGFFGLGCDAVPAADARDLGYPGFQGLGLPAADAPAREPYIYHFPDGNASLARLLVRALVPEVAQGRGMDDVVLAAFDYGKLDRDAQDVRIRLDFDLRRSPQRRRQGAHRLRAGRRAAPRRGAARGARLLPHGHSAHHAGAAGAAARGAGAERQDADRLHQRAHPQLAAVGAAGRARHLGADVVPQPREARFSREPGRLPPFPRPVASRSACTWSTLRARPTTGSTPAPSSASARPSCST